MTTIDEAFEVLPSPDIFSYGHRQHRAIRLANQMKVLLVHDRTVHDGSFRRNRATCAISIDVGTLSDPPDIPGLAQLVVHTFFSSNKEIGELPCRRAAGSDESVYTCLLQMESLDETLAQLAEILKNPLSVECDALNYLEEMYENCGNSWSYLAIELSSQTANIGHPARQYVDREFISKDKIDANSLERRMAEFAYRHYSAHRMSLCLCTNLPLDEMQDLVVKHFSSVPNNMLPGIDFSPFTHENAYQSRFHENVFFMKDSKSIPEITLTWCVPPETSASQCKPYHFLEYILETECENSISAYLEKKNSVWSLKTSINTNAVFTMFQISVRYFDESVTHVDDVLEVLFSYIRLKLQELKHSESLEQLYWDSVNHDRKYMFCQIFRPDESERTLTELTNYTRNDKYDADAVAKAIDSLNERKFNITIVSNNEYDESFEYCDMLDKANEATYAESAIPGKWTELWNNPKTFTEIVLPPVNPYIANDFSLVYDVNQPKPRYPEKVYETDVSELWFRPGSQCLDVSGGCYFYFQSSISSNSPKNVTMLAVLERILETREEHKMYKFTQQTSSFERHGACLTFKLLGPNHKQRLIMDDVTKMLKQFVLNVTEEEFQNAVRDERIDIKRKMRGSPIEYTEEVLRSFVRIGYVAPHETLQPLDSVKFADFREFCQQFFTQTKVRALIQGNHTVDEAKSIMQTVETNLDCKKVDEIVETKKIGRTLPATSHRFSIKSFNGEQKKTARLTYYQIGAYTLRRKVLMDLLNQIIRLSSLGINEMLIRYEWINSMDDGMLGGSLAILSEENESRDAFMTDFGEKFPKFAISDVEHTSAALFQERLRDCLEDRDGNRDKLEREINRNWLEILSGEYCFDRSEQEREILSTISQSDVVQFATNFFEPTTRRLFIEYIGYKETCEISSHDLVYAEIDSTESDIRIDDIDEFKAMLDGGSNDKQQLTLPARQKQK